MRARGKTVKDLVTTRGKANPKSLMCRQIFDLATHLSDAKACSSHPRLLQHEDPSYKQCAVSTRGRIILKCRKGQVSTLFQATRQHEASSAAGENRACLRDYEGSNINRSRCRDRQLQDMVELLARINQTAIIRERSYRPVK